jgi:formate hydrogenlyase subunit 4
VLYAQAVKMFLLSSVLLHLALPFGFGAPLQDGVVFVAGMLALAVAIGVVESVMARLRLHHVPSLLIASGVLCAFGFVLTLAR